VSVRDLPIHEGGGGDQDLAWRCDVRVGNTSIKVWRRNEGGRDEGRKERRKEEEEEEEEEEEGGGGGGGGRGGGGEEGRENLGAFEVEEEVGL